MGEKKTCLVLQLGWIFAQLKVVSIRGFVQRTYTVKVPLLPVLNSFVEEEEGLAEQDVISRE